MRRTVVGSCALALAVLAAGCESTQSVSARLEKESKATLLNQQGVTVTGASNPDVRLGEPTVLQDENGTAVAVEVRARGSRALARVPLAVTVTDRAGRAIGANDAPGLDPSLTGLPVLPAGDPVLWVNDQLLTDGEAAAATVKAGEARPRSGEIPRLRLTPGGLQQDPSSGASAIGRVTNESTVEQRNLIVTVAARRGGRIVAAGRGQVPRLRARATVAYQVFFVGDPAGAELETSVLPTVLP